MSELPKAWTTSTVGDLADSIQYGHTAKSSKMEVGPRFLRITDIQDNNVDWSSVPFCPIPKNQIPKYRLDKGDLLFARTGATVGKSFLIQTEIPESVFASYLIRVRVTKAIESRYLYYFFQSSDYWRQISDSSSGIGQPNVNGKKLAAIKLPIAPLPEQRRIVARIEELFSRLDAGVAALRHAKAQLQRYRQSVLAAAVTGQLTQAWREQQPDTEPAEELLFNVLAERKATWAGRGKYPLPLDVEDNLSQLPKGWVWTTLAHLANHIADGTHKTPTYVEAGIPFLSAKDVNGFKLSFGNCRYIPREEHEDLIKRCRPKPGNVLVTKNGTIGRIAVVKTEDEFSLFESVANVPVIAPLFSDFIAYAAHVGIAGAFGAKNKKGVAVRHLHLEDLRRLPIPLPPLAEQPQIVAEAEARTTAIDHLEAELDRQITRSNRLRQSTLSSAFQGEL